MNKIIFLVLALAGMAAHAFTFAFRYLWYLSSGAYSFAIAGYLLCALGIIFLWARKPSLAAVGALGLIALVFPPILRPKDFVGVDVVYGIYAVVAVALLVGATYYRKVKIRTVKSG